MAMRMAMALGALAVILAGAGVGRWGEAAGDLGPVVIGKANDGDYLAVDTRSI